MREAGVDISQQESTQVTLEMLAWADLVTVCSHADEYCPALPPQIRKPYWPKTTGSEEEIVNVFRATHDDIRFRVSTLFRDFAPGRGSRKAIRTIRSTTMGVQCETT